MSCGDKRQHNDDTVYRRQNEEHIVDGQNCRAGNGEPVILMEKRDKRKYSGEEYSNSKDGEYYFKLFHRVHTYLF